MGVKWFFSVILWVSFCVCVFQIIFASAQRGFTICDVQGCNCTFKAAPWKTINCSLHEEQVVNFEPSLIPRETFEIYIEGGKSLRFVPKTFNSLPTFVLIRINGTKAIVMENKSFYNINSSSLLIQIFNCDELIIKTGAFEYMQSSVYLEVADVMHITIEPSAFSKLSSSTFKNVQRIGLEERAFDFKNQGNIGRLGPVTTISFNNVAIPDIPKETFLKSIASVKFENCQIGDIRGDAFTATEISAVTMINTTVRSIQEGAFADITLICDLKISKCNISKLQSRAIKAAIGNFTLHHSILMDIEPRAIVSTIAKVEILGNQISNLQSSGFIFHNWNSVLIDDNIIKDLHKNFIDVINHADIEKFSFKGNEIYNAEEGALSFLSQLDERNLIFDDNFFNQSCDCTIDKWLQGVTNTTTKVKVAMDTSFCTVNEFVSKCFSLPVGIINIQNFTEKMCSNFTKCEPYEGKTRVINTTSKIFLATEDDNKQNWLFFIITIIGLFILATVATFVVLLVRGSRWLKEKGYFRNMHYNNNDLSHEDEATVVTVDENEKLEIPEELTLDFLQLLSQRLDDPSTHQEASEMIERLYEMFIVDDSYENNNRDEEAHLYEELGNLNLQIPPPPYEEEREQTSGARSILRLMEEKFNLQSEEQGPSNSKPALMGDYSEPTDAAVHLYSELKNKNDKSDRENQGTLKSCNSNHTLRPLPKKPVENILDQPGPSTKL